VSCEVAFPELEPEISEPVAEGWELGEHVKEEEFTRR